MSDPTWLLEARACIGQREVPGPQSNAWIRDLWLGLKNGSWYWSHFKSDDSLLPWCGAFVAGCLHRCGIEYPTKYASALAWRDWGEPIEMPALGAIASYRRKGGGHVGFVAGMDKSARIMVLGGNQRDAVSILPFDQHREVVYRFPPGLTPVTYRLPIIDSNGVASSSNEA